MDPAIRQIEKHKFLVEIYCECGKSAKYQSVTEESATASVALWNRQHNGIGHQPITAMEFKANRTVKVGAPTRR